MKPIAFLLAVDGSFATIALVRVDLPIPGEPVSRKFFVRCAFTSSAATPATMAAMRFSRKVRNARLKVAGDLVKALKIAPPMVKTKTLDPKIHILSMLSI